MRFLGRRVAAQFTLFEISIVVTLAAAIGVPLQASNRGLLPPLIIALVVIVLQRGLSSLVLRSERFEELIYGGVPGLSLSPDHDDAFNRDLQVAGTFACWSCGNVAVPDEASLLPCEACGADHWMPVVITRQ